MSGVQAGERIVVAGVHKLSSGEQVRVIDPAKPLAEPQSQRRPTQPRDDTPQSLRVGAAPPLAGRLPDRRADARRRAVSYFRLGRAEDPDFTFKAMVVRTLWPGATAHEVELQVTERIEKKLQEVPWVDVLRSQTRPASR
jgi:hypothetical protein